MKRDTWMRAAALAIAVAATGACGKGTSGAGPAGSASAAGSAAIGGDDPVIALARAAATGCKVDEYGNYDSDCAAYKALDDSALIADGKGDASLVKLLEDPSDVMRRLGVEMLRSHAKAAWDDKDLAGRILAVAEKETSQKVAFSSLGGDIGSIHVKATGTLERIKAIVKSPKDPAMAQSIVRSLIGANPTDDDVWAWQKERIKDGDPKIRKAAIGAFWGNPFNLRPAQTCAVYRENFTHSDGAVAAIAMSHSSGSERCIGDLDAAIDETEKRLKAGAPGVPDDAASDLFNTLRDPWKNEKVTDKQKKRKLAIAKEAAQNTKLSAMIRRVALGAVKDDDPAGAKAFAQKFLKDKEKDVASLAKSISEGK